VPWLSSQLQPWQQLKETSLPATKLGPAPCPHTTLEPRPGSGKKVHFLVPFGPALRDPSHRESPRPLKVCEGTQCVQ
jgi:hypothetical protein